MGYLKTNINALKSMFGDISRGHISDTIVKWWGQGKFHLCQGLFDDRNTKENRDAQTIKRIVFYTKLE